MTTSFQPQKETIYLKLIVKIVAHMIMLVQIVVVDNFLRLLEPDFFLQIAAADHLLQILTVVHDHSFLKLFYITIFVQVVVYERFCENFYLATFYLMFYVTTFSFLQIIVLKILKSLLLFHHFSNYIGPLSLEMVIRDHFFAN